MNWVVSRVGHATVHEWRSHIEGGDWPGFVTSVLRDHYDPAYKRSAAQRSHNDIAVIEAEALDRDAITLLADRLLKHT